MASLFSFHNREAVRVKVKKCEGFLQPEYRKFSVDPQITSFEVLQSLLARAFDIKGEFTISYIARDDFGQETFLALLSDWDLDAAFLGASDPCLTLKVDLKPFEEGYSSNKFLIHGWKRLDDWDIIAPVDYPQPKVSSNDRNTIAGTILNQMEKTFNLVQRALSFSDTDSQSMQIKPPKPPMTDKEFHNFLDSEGKVVRSKELRLSVYRGGLEPSLRRVAWKHVLNVYPEGLSGRERVDYIRRKGAEYHKLRVAWQDAVRNGTVTEEMQFVMNMVRKDVLRTDRAHKFYAGADDNANVVALFNILATYSLHHPSVSYCQGMSDLASPLLVVMCNEAQAYVCFCALMKRLRPNFLLDGKAMSIKFQHLADALKSYDSFFFSYLQHCQADDLLFCYRWLLLEMKREFAFEDALRMLEVLWSSLPPDPPSKELPLFEIEFSATHHIIPHSPKLFSKENPYTKVRAIRRQSSGSSISSLRQREAALSAANSQEENPRSPALKTSLPPSPLPSSAVNKAKEGCGCGTRTPPPTHVSSNGVSSLRRQESLQEGDLSNDEYLPVTTSVTRELRMELDSLNRSLPGTGDLSKLYQRMSTLDSDDIESVMAVEVGNAPSENVECGGKKPYWRAGGSDKSDCEEEEDQEEDEGDDDAFVADSEGEDEDKDEPASQRSDDSEDLSTGECIKSFGASTRKGPRGKPRRPLRNHKRSVLNAYNNSNNNNSCHDNDRNSDCDPRKNVKVVIRSVAENGKEMESERSNSACSSRGSQERDEEEEENSVAYNGEIIENEDGGSQLRSVVPIHLVKTPPPTTRGSHHRRARGRGDSSGSDSSDSAAPTASLECARPTVPSAGALLKHRVSDGYASAEGGPLLSSSADYKSGSGLDDSGVMTNSCEEALEFVQYANSLANSNSSSAAQQHPRAKRTQETTKAPPTSINLASRSGGGGGNGPSSPKLFSPVHSTVVSTKTSCSAPPLLPPPHEFGGGNPFLMFLCLTLLLQHRDHIVKNRMDYNELAMHFDKMVRKHNVARVLHQARSMFAEYLRGSWSNSNSEESNNWDLNV